MYVSKKKMLLTILVLFNFQISFGTPQDYYEKASKNIALDIYPYATLYKQFKNVLKIDSVFGLIQKQLKEQALQQLNLIAYSNAIDRLGYHNQALNILTNLNKQLDKLPLLVQSEYYVAMGNISMRSMNPQMAVLYFRNSLEIITKVKNISREIIQAKYLTLGTGLNALLEHNEAMQVYEKAMDMEVGVNRNSLYLRLNIALTNSYLGRINKAEKYFTNALQIIQFNKDYFAEMRTYGNLADIYKQQDSSVKAKLYYHKGLSLAKKHGFNLDIIRFKRELSDMCHIEGALDSAYIYLKKADSISNHYNSRQINDKIVEMNMYHKVQRERLEKEMATVLYQKEQHQKVIFRIFSCIFFFICIGLLYQLRQIKHKRKTLLQQRLKELKKNQTTSAKTEPKHLKYEQLIQQLKTSIEEENIYTDNNLSLDKLAKILQTNRTYLSEAINSYYNKNFSQWLNEIRINASIKLLASSEFDLYSIEGIAKNVGFSSTSAFNSNFKKVTGLTPSYFRKNRYTADI